MTRIPWSWFRGANAIAHIGVQAVDSRRGRAICGAEIVDELADDDVHAASVCESCGNVGEELAEGRQLRAWRACGYVFACQQAPDVVAVHVGGLEIHVWRHPDGALIEALERDSRRHAAYVSICRDPEEAGARAVILAISHGSQCAERPLWPVTNTDFDIDPRWPD